MSADAKRREKRNLEVWRLRDGKRLVLIVQSDLLLQLDTRVVVPVVPLGSFKHLEEINPVVEVGGQQFVLASQAISSIRIVDLAVKVDDLADRHADVLRALDRLLTTSV